MATDAELLTKVNAAIETRLDGGAVQSYAIGGRNLAYIPIEELYDLKASLEASVAATTSGGARNYASFERPT